MPNRIRGTEYEGGASGREGEGGGGARPFAGYGGSYVYGGYDAPRGPHYGKGPKGYKRSDERIREDVSDAIAFRSGIDAGDVDVKVEGGIVTLEGTVRERRDKRLLETLAEDVDGVLEVRCELRLAKGEGH
jgi:osmotically-inducible protein OsmY